jgi:hypothetical protein
VSGVDNFEIKRGEMRRRKRTERDKEREGEREREREREREIERERESRVEKNERASCDTYTQSSHKKTESCLVSFPKKAV